jgi:hypothetical protein
VLEGAYSVNCMCFVVVLENGRRVVVPQCSRLADASPNQLKLIERIYLSESLLCSEHVATAVGLLAVMVVTHLTRHPRL